MEATLRAIGTNIPHGASAMVFIWPAIKLVCWEEPAWLVPAVQLPHLPAAPETHTPARQWDCGPYFSKHQAQLQTCVSAHSPCKATGCTPPPAFPSTMAAEGCQAAPPAEAAPVELAVNDNGKDTVPVKLADVTFDPEVLGAQMALLRQHTNDVPGRLFLDMCSQIAALIGKCGTAFGMASTDIAEVRDVLLWCPGTGFAWRRFLPLPAVRLFIAAQRGTYRGTTPPSALI